MNAIAYLFSFIAILYPFSASAVLAAGDYSSTLKAAGESVHVVFPDGEIYLGGGGALNLVQSIEQGAEFNPRDLDLSVVVNRDFTIQDLDRVRALIAAQPGLALKDMHDPERTIKFGSSKVHVDVGFRRNRQELLDRGFFSVDKIKIRLIKPEYSPEKGLKQGLVFDPTGGYQDAKDHTFKIHGPAVDTIDFATLIVVSVRTANKVGAKEVPADVVAKIDEKRESPEDFSPRSFVYKYMSKILWDKARVKELKMMAALQGIAPLSIELEEKVLAIDSQDLAARIDKDENLDASDEMKFIVRYRNLVSLTSSAEQKRLAVLMQKYYPEFVEAWLRDLSGESR